MKLAKPTIRFSVELSGTYVTLPKSVSTKFKRAKDVTGVTKIEGVINSLPFLATLKTDTKGNCSLKVSSPLYRAPSAPTGEKVTVEIMSTGEELETRTPTDLRKALKATPEARALWEDITPIARRDWIYWVSTAKQAETRARRIETACSKLSHGMRRVCCFPGIQWLMKNGGKNTRKNK